MDVTVFGTTNKKLTFFLEEAAGFYAYYLMKPRTVNRLKIDIELTPYRKMEEQGAVLNEDTHLRYPSNFVIELRRPGSDDPDIFKVLAHEMVHVKQYAKNELATNWKKCSDTGTLRPQYMWRNAEWQTNRQVYIDLPWEAEAYRLENEMYSAWLVHKTQF